MHFEPSLLSPACWLLRGSLMLLTAVTAAWMLRRWLPAGSRAALLLLAAAGCLIPAQGVLLFSSAPLPLPAASSIQEPLGQWLSAPNAAWMSGSRPVLSPQSVLVTAWIGVSLFLCLRLALETSAGWKRFAGRRFSTDARLLGLLEDARRAMNVQAPVGLVVGDDISQPALFGWMRPRILLPSGVAEAFSDRQLGLLLRHELAHFRRMDTAASWIFSTLQIVLWFNPLAHLAACLWRQCREEAADAEVLRQDSKAAGDYAAVLAAAAETFPEPSLRVGAAGFCESFQTLKHRILMIQSPIRPSFLKLACMACLSLGLAALILSPARAAESSEAQKEQAAKATLSWLALMDKGDYAESWKQASPLFQKAAREEQWVAMGNSVRTSLGACTGRKLVSQALSVDPPNAAKGTYIVSQYESSFENMAYATETVSFMLTPDGAWKAAGYYIKPR